MTDSRCLPETIQTIPEVIAFWANVTPDAPALRSLDWRTISYRELHAATTRIAVALATRGIGREDRVALFVPPGFEATVIKLGGTKTESLSSSRPDSRPR